MSNKLNPNQTLAKSIKLTRETIVGFNELAEKYDIQKEEKQKKESLSKMQEVKDDNLLKYMLAFGLVESMDAKRRNELMDFHFEAYNYLLNKDAKTLDEAEEVIKFFRSRSQSIIWVDTIISKW